MALTALWAGLGPALDGIASVMAEVNRGEELRQAGTRAKELSRSMLLAELRAANKIPERDTLLEYFSQTAAAEADQAEAEARFFAASLRFWGGVGERVIRSLPEGTETQ